MSAVHATDHTNPDESEGQIIGEFDRGVSHVGFGGVISAMVRVAGRLPVELQDGTMKEYS